MENTALYKPQKIENWIHDQVKNVLEQSIEVCYRTEDITIFEFVDYDLERLLKDLLDVEVMAKSIDINDEVTIDFYIFRALIRVSKDESYNDENSCKYYEKDLSLRWISDHPENGEEQVKKLGKALYKFVRKIIEKLVIGKEPMMRHDKKFYKALVSQIIEERRMDFKQFHVDEEMI